MIFIVSKSVFQLKWNKLKKNYQKTMFFMLLSGILYIIQFWLDIWPPNYQILVFWNILDYWRPLTTLGARSKLLTEKNVLSDTVLSRTDESYEKRSNSSVQHNRGSSNCYVVSAVVLWNVWWNGLCKKFQVRGLYIITQRCLIKARQCLK